MYGHALRPLRLQVHLYAACFFVVAGDVPEIGEHEIRFKFAIDASQNIQIEACGDAEWIVVGSEQLWNRFFQIRPQQQRISKRDAKVGPQPRKIAHSFV